MKQVDTVKIESRDGYCAWKIDLDGIAYDTKLTVSNGCTGLYFENGSFAENFIPGRYTINLKKNRKTVDDVSLIGVNTGRDFEALWGIGQVKFRDRKYKTDAEVGMHGTYTFQIVNAPRFCTSFGDGAVTVEDVQKSLRPVIAQAATAVLSSVTDECGYLGLQARQQEIAEEVAERLNPILIEKGIRLSGDRFVVKELCFNDEYLQIRSEADADARKMKSAEDEVYIEGLRNREEKERMRNMGEFIQSVSTKSEEKTHPDACPFCGMKLTESTLFCPRCGRKIC